MLEIYYVHEISINRINLIIQQFTMSIIFLNSTQEFSCSVIWTKLGLIFHKLQPNLLLAQLTSIAVLMEVEEQTVVQAPTNVEKGKEIVTLMLSALAI